jgi:hypothetical protein
MNKLLYIFLLLLITACDSFKEKVGLVREQPDEYQVISNPPLSIPPDLTNIRSPEEIEKNKSSMGQKNNKNLSKGENSILEKFNK